MATDCTGRADSESSASERARRSRPPQLDPLNGAAYTFHYAVPYGARRDSRPARGRNMPSDPFQILQVPRQASPDQIRAAYLRLVLAHHPDLNPGDALAAERFKQVQRAYEQIVQRFPARERSSFGAALDPPFVRAQLASSHAARSRGLASSA